MTKSLAAGTATEEERSAAARAMGSAKTERKAAAARANGFKPGNALGGRAPVPLAEIRCTCEAGDALTGHHWSCPRGQAIIRRQKQDRDVLTGEKLGGSK